MPANPFEEIRQEDLAYVAGLFDGEGCVNFARSKGGHFIRVFIVSTNRAVLEFLKDLFGGDISKRPLGGTHARWKPVYRWRLQWSNAVKFLVLIYPWLRIKKEHAEVALAWNRLRPWTKLPDSFKATHRDAMSVLMDRLRQLNRKGRGALASPIMEAETAPCH